MTTEKTLDELKALGLIELVEYVRDKLLAQGKKSQTLNAAGKLQCAYRGDGGTRCAAGWLIPESLYRCTFENLCWSHVRNMNPQLQFSTPEFPFKDSLIEDMQTTHDWYPIEGWEERFNSLIREIKNGKYGNVEQYQS